MQEGNGAMSLKDNHKSGKKRSILALSALLLVGSVGLILYFSPQQGIWSCRRIPAAGNARGDFQEQNRLIEAIYQVRSAIELYYCLQTSVSAGSGFQHLLQLTGDAGFAKRGACKSEARRLQQWAGNYG